MNTVFSLLEKPRNNFRSGSFHKLRVEIKKLNALLDLLHFCSKNFRHKRIFKPFKTIYFQAGKVRELQIEEAMFKKYLPAITDTGYNIILKKRRAKEQNGFFLLINKKLETRLKRKQKDIAGYLSDLDLSKAKKYMKKMKKNISEMLSESKIRIQDLHKIRKKIKQYNYNRTGLNAEKQNDSCDVLTSLLGKWHDCLIMLDHMKKNLNFGLTDSKEIEQLDKVRSKILSESEKFFSKILKAIPRSEFYLNPA